VYWKNKFVQLQSGQKKGLTITGVGVVKVDNSKGRNRVLRRKETQVRTGVRRRQLIQGAKT
jgi:hypothetical protein